MAEERTFTAGPHALCDCGWAQALSLEKLHGYFDGAEHRCDKCGDVVDWFRAMSLASDFVFSTFAAVGAHNTSFFIALSPGEVKEIDFASKMSEPDGRILFVNYTPQGTEAEKIVFPVELHGNSPHRKWFSKVHVLGRGAPHAPETKISVSFVWIPRSKDDASWESLVDAFEALHQHEYADAVLPANVAVEVRFGRFFADLIRSRTDVGRERIANFLKDGATYGHQLDVLLPLVCALASLPKPLDKIQEGLKRLRRQRNSIAHSGVPDNGLIEKEEAIKVAVAAVLACVYVDYLRERLGLKDS